MTPRGKRGKLKKPKRVFHSFHRAWKSGKRRTDILISTAPTYVSHSTRRKKDAAETEFHLTIPVTSITMISPASLRSDRDRHRVGISARDQIGITDHLHRNQHHARAHSHYPGCRLARALVTPPLSASANRPTASVSIEALP